MTLASPECHKALVAKAGKPDNRGRALAAVKTADSQDSQDPVAVAVAAEPVGHPVAAGLAVAVAAAAERMVAAILVQKVTRATKGT